MKKRKFKVIIAAAVASILLCLPLSAAAAEEASEQVEATEQEVLDEQELTVESNIFELAYEAVLAHADRILSALSFIGAMLVGFAYKKGLMPMVNDALTRLSGTVKGIKENADKESAVRADEMKLVKEGIAVLESSISGWTEAMSDIDRRLGSICEGSEQLAGLKSVMRAQVEMLYDIFISSALPEYQKEAVGMRINEMKKLLEAEDLNE